MPHPLQRGAVVVRDRRFGVVWEVRVGEMVLLPILRARHDMAIDVPLSLAELLACGVTVADAVVRPRPGPAIGVRGHDVVGALAGPLLCRVVLGVIRAQTDAANHAKWADEKRQHRRAANERCVNLLK